MLGLRFHRDKYCPPQRFTFLKERLGDGFVAVELSPDDAHPQGTRPFAHSVLTGDLIDQPGQPTRAALDQVLDVIARRLLNRA